MTYRSALGLAAIILAVCEPSAWACSEQLIDAKMKGDPSSAQIDSHVGSFDADQHHSKDTLEDEAWFTITEIDDQTFIIGEPHSPQKNHNYLIMGEQRAILFDSGPGLEDITPVVQSLTDLPVVATFSHAHFDHIGNHEHFDQIALLDVPSLRDQVRGETFRPCRAQYLGGRPPSFTITEWWAPGEIIDLGGRHLRVLHLPGHTEGSMALVDEDRALLFTGDFLYPGTLLANLPGSSILSYAQSSKILLGFSSAQVEIYGAHATAMHPNPTVQRQSLAALSEELDALINGQTQLSGILHPINDEISMLIWRDWTVESDDSKTPACAY